MGNLKISNNMIEYFFAQKYSILYRMKFLGGNNDKNKKDCSNYHEY